jgi:hypothetical protein
MSKKSMQKRKKCGWNLSSLGKMLEALKGQCHEIFDFLNGYSRTVKEHSTEIHH